MKVSLICPIFSENSKSTARADWTLRLQDLESFFKAFPIEVELVAVVDSKDTTDTTWKTLSEYDFQKVKLKAHLNTEFLGRGAAVARGLSMATGDLLIVCSADWALSLGEMFKFIQEALAQPEIDLFLGNRFSPKKKTTGTRTRWHHVLEMIVFEKAKNKFPSFKDPTCPYWAIRRSALTKLSENFDSNQWFYTLDLLKRLPLQGISVQEIDLQVRFTASERIPLWREFLRNAF
ncbi:MAG: glycosyltransferase family 2 protein [Pseudobdellovibrionaceae bacterium]